MASMVTTAPSIAIMSKQRGNGDDLVGFLRHRDLPQDETLAGGEGRDHVDRLLRALLSDRSGARSCRRWR